MNMTIALVGNPNSGKTTLFNQLTGNHQYVGNWPGVTVERKTGHLKNQKNIEVVDLPGIYSLSPYSNEEVVSRNYLSEGNPDVIINIVDASNLERNLYLTTQLMEFGIPLVVALNQMDIVKKRGYTIKSKELSEQLQVPVVEISALKGEGIEDLVSVAVDAAATKAIPAPIHFAAELETALKQIEEQLPSNVTSYMRRYCAIKVFERDEAALKEFGINLDCDKLILDTEGLFDDLSDSIIINERYRYIESFIDRVHKRAITGRTTSEKIDSVLTNRVLALPIFVLIITLIYYISISTVGSYATDWANDGVFGEGWYLDFAAPFMGEDYESQGLWIPGIPTIIGEALASAGCVEWLYNLIMDGIVAGVGAVLGFVPQIMILFFLLAILESCGYMARVTFILDRLFRRFGLSGKSFVPMIVGTGCGVPGIMSSRTIESESARRLTIMTTTFMPCSAKLPIIALISTAIFEGAWWVAPLAYFMGIAAIIISGIMLRKTRPFLGNITPYVMELPEYRMPRFVDLLRSMWERAWEFIRKAGTIILLASVVVWFLSGYGIYEGEFAWVGEDLMDYSFLAYFGNAFAWIFAPLGFDNWGCASSVVTGLIAKENAISTMAIVYGGNPNIEWTVAYMASLAQTTGSVLLVPAAAFSFMTFQLLCAPCFAAMGAIKCEMGGFNKWFWAAIAWECGFAYVISLIIFQIGAWIITGMFTVGTAVGLLCVLAILYMLFRPTSKPKPAAAADTTA